MLSSREWSWVRDGGLLGWGRGAAASVFPQRKSRFFSLLAWRTESLCKGHCGDEVHGNDQGWLSSPWGGEDGCATMQVVVGSSCFPWADPPVPWDPPLCSEEGDEGALRSAQQWGEGRCLQGAETSACDCQQEDSWGQAFSMSGVTRKRQDPWGAASPHQGQQHLFICHPSSACRWVAGSCLYPWLGRGNRRGCMELPVPSCSPQHLPASSSSNFSSVVLFIPSSVQTCL